MLDLLKKTSVILLIFIFMLLINSSLIYYIPFILIHELTHLYVGVRLGYTILGIRVLPFGFAGSFVEEFIDPLDEILIILSGPLVNFIFFLIFLFLSKINPLFQNISQANLVLCVFNLIPAGILDGGKILKNVFKMYFSFYSAYYIININGIILGCLIFFVGLFTNSSFNRIVLLLMGSYLIYIDYINQKEIIIKTIADIINKNNYISNFKNNKLFCTIVTKDCKILSIIKGYNYYKSKLLLVFLEGRIIKSFTEKEILEVYFKQGNVLLSEIEITYIGGK